MASMICDHARVEPRCCAHSEEEHRLLPTCQEVIHYPSEDYPCLCEGFEGDGESCARCQHARAKHVITRVCQPEGGEYCGCGVLS